MVEVMLAHQRSDKLLCLVGCCAVADGDECNPVCSNEFQEHLCCGPACAVALRHLDDAARKDVAGRIDDRHLASCTVARVKSQYRMSCERRLQAQLAQIAPEHSDCLFLRCLSQP